MSTKTYRRTGKGGIKMRALAIVFLVPFLFLLSSCGGKEIALSNSLDVKPEIGYDKTVSLWKGNPVKFSITNAGKDFKGEIRIKVPIRYDEDASFIIPIEVAENSQKTIEQYIPLNLVVKEFVYEVVSDGKTIKQGKLNANVFLDPQISKIAVISDKPDRYSFLSEAGLNSFYSQDYDKEIVYHKGTAAQTDRVQTRYPQSKNFLVYQKNMSRFSNRDALAFFNYIFIGDVSDLNLSEEGLENLQDWISDGGILIIETGENFEKMERVLPEALKLARYDSVEELTLIGEGGSSKTVKLAKGEKRGDEVKEVFLGDKLLAYRESIGAGGILTVNTLMGTEHLGDLNKNGAFFQNIVGEADILTLPEPEEDRYGPKSYLVESVPSEAELPYDLIGVILLFYALVAVPLLYLLLKKSDKRSLMWVLAPGMALLVILTISQIGNYVWGNKPILNEVSVIQYRQGDTFLKAETEMALFNNRKSDMKVSWNGKENVEIKYTDRYDFGLTDRADKIINSSARYLQNPPLFYSYKTSLWGNVRAEGSKTLPIKDLETGVRLEYVDGKEIVKVKNGLPMHFSEAVLYWNGKYYVIGGLAAGEEKSLEMHNLKPRDDAYELDRDILNEKVSALVDLMRDDAELYIDRDFRKPTLFGYNTDPVGYEIEINDETPKSFARNLVVMRLEMKIEDGSEIAFNENNIDAAHYGEYSDRLQAESYSPGTSFQLHGYRADLYELLEVQGQESNINSIVTDFHLPTKMQIDSIIVDMNNNCYETFSSFENLRGGWSEEQAESMKERYFIFNHLENKYDEISFEAFLKESPVIIYGDPAEDTWKEPPVDPGFDSLGTVENPLLAAKWYEVDKAKYVSANGLLRIKVLKPELFDRKWYEVKNHSIIVKGVYHD